MDATRLRRFEHLSPFEIKDELIRRARMTTSVPHLAFLNAGRGNPNWIATTPRDGFFLLGQFAMTESTSVMNHPAGLGGMPRADGIAGRLAQWLTRHGDSPGATFLQAAVAFAVDRFDFTPDAFVHELVDGIIGDNYPVPDRMLVHNEAIVHEYLMWAMCGEPRPPGRFDLFATEGGTAAICYLFRSLKGARLLNPGDTIALGTPIFTPYLEIPELEDYALNTVHVRAEQEDRFQFTEADFRQLEDPAVKAFFLVNPGNPTGVALSAETIARLVHLVTTKRPDLILLTDDVYGTFVPGFRSLLGTLPRNTIGVYSYSKYFGCTGWRLGVIAIHQDNIFDEMISRHPEDIGQALDRRYGALRLKPREMKFIDRIVADSRDVALNHTAGLSLPQQVMMMLFSLFDLMDEAKTYQRTCREIVQRRFRLAADSLGLDVHPGPLYDAYYGLFDLEFWLRRNLGEDVVAYIKANVHPLDLVFRLAEEYGIVLLNGGGFDAPNWSVRISFANLDDEAYAAIGTALRAVTADYVRHYEASRKAGG
ncbi:MAG: bifunctional aspartate transaminase/aspartate 4-decarboxylase [Acetobacteraceae bacterium]